MLGPRVPTDSGGSNKIISPSSSQPPETLEPPTPLKPSLEDSKSGKLSWFAGGIGLLLLLVGVAVFISFPTNRNKSPVLTEQALPQPQTPVIKEDNPPQKKDVGDKGGMVEVPAGDFWMGCNEKVDQECDDDEKPGKMVSLPAFRIDKTEVTVAAYRRCVEAGKCTSDGLTMPYWNGKEQPDWAWACNWGKAGKDDRPINCVDWDQADTYCRWIGERLPTEAEWEKAARGTDGRKYSWGNTDFVKAGKVANIADETAKKQQPGWPIAEGYDDGFYDTAPVGAFPAGVSPFGALDMIGNVWEWTADWYAADYYKNGPTQSPKGPEKGEYRSVRGGSWNALRRRARASSRSGNGPGNRVEGVGVRCAQ